ncbi:MAG: N-acetylmannosamine-6-phosphate 2-epimerase [Pyrinomonadaceae bacterium]|nr:N-acetylmannosamine-6-phosphate 2-epimerase [Pyrinomonadaceae bacterium]
MELKEIITAWQGGLVVSCQAAADSPLARPDIIAALALTAARNGAVGVRIDGAENIVAVRGAGVNVPVIGIEKQLSEGSEVYITPTYDSAARVAGSGADVIALDATGRARPGGEKLSEIVGRIKRGLRRPVMADVATYEEGRRAAEEAGADFVGTTLSGYTAETVGNDAPDFPLVEQLAARLSVPVICEGRLRSAEDVRRAFECGAFAVVIGGAITGVDWLVRHYVAATGDRGRRSDVSE